MKSSSQALVRARPKAKNEPAPNMPRFTAELLKRYNHEAVDVRDIGMGGAADSDIAAYAQQNRLLPDRSR